MSALAAIVVGLALAIPTAPGQLTPAAAKAAFGRLIRDRYPSAQGYWTCPAAQQFRCLAEVRVGQKRHLLSGAAKLSGTRIVFTNVADRSWVRRWSAYSKQVIRGFGSPGTASVNGPYFDWAFLAAGAYDAWRRGRKTFAAGAYDGPGTGLAVFYSFACKTRADLITCTNKLGDSMRYAPRGLPGTG